MTNLTKSILILAAAAATMPLLQGCFTGVESTPKITQREIKKRHITETAESKLLGDIRPQKPSEWKSGKQFYVCDDRIGLILNPLTATADSLRNSLAGDTLTFCETTWANSLTGGQEAVMEFEGPRGSRFTFRPGIPSVEFGERERLTLPFTVDLTQVREVADRIKGRQYYILVSRRTDSLGVETTGMRYQPVTITDVTAGTDTQPLRVAFTDEAGQHRIVTMTLGNDATATRNFDTLFAFDNPRKKYPNVTDEVWDLVVHSRVRAGMTPAECRLALGAPNDYLRLPSTAGMVERWVYDDGVYLIFEDGQLANFRK